MKTVACSAARRAGFTLIELMIVVAIIGVLASLGIPIFRTVMTRSKAAEATTNLGQLFKSAAAYYTIERSDGQGQDAKLVSGCTIGEITPGVPGAQKQRLPDEAGFRAIGFTVAEYVYFAYGVDPESGVTACTGTANDPTVYTMYANGDLDDDGLYSLFQLAVGSDANNELYHARGFFIENELE